MSEPIEPPLSEDQQQRFLGFIELIRERLDDLVLMSCTLDGKFVPVIAMVDHQLSEGEVVVMPLVILVEPQMSLTFDGIEPQSFDFLVNPSTPDD